MVLVHFNGDSRELRQLLHIGIMNHTGQPISHSLAQPQQPPIHDRPSMGIPMLHHMSTPLIVSNNDSWKNVIQAQPLCSIQGWPIVSLDPPATKENISHHPRLVVLCHTFSTSSTSTSYIC